MAGKKLKAAGYIVKGVAYLTSSFAAWAGSKAFDKATGKKRDH